MVIASTSMSLAPLARASAFFFLAALFFASAFACFFLPGYLRASGSWVEAALENARAALYIRRACSLLSGPLVFAFAVAAFAWVWRKYRL